ncbi:response regulator [bacterium]|nr:response regulator [bacterium]
MDILKALLVDDEEELVSTLVERLGYRGVIAQYALTGPDALDKLRTEKFDVVVLDLKMPGMSGLDVLTVIKREFPAIPVLLITGHGSPTDSSDVIPDGAYDFLPKPVSLEKLIEKIREAVAAQ